MLQQEKAELTFRLHPFCACCQEDPEEDHIAGGLTFHGRGLVTRPRELILASQLRVR